MWEEERLTKEREMIVFRPAAMLNKLRDGTLVELRLGLIVYRSLACFIDRALYVSYCARF